jgi:nucleotide-binding universal stress UspA family protein
MSTIVIGFDGSPAAERALERVADIAGPGARVLVVTATAAALPPRSLVDDPLDDGPSPGERGALLEQAAVALRARGVEPALVAADDPAAQALVRAARAEQADLIVVGRTGSGYATRAILGSTAEQIIRQAPCDVLIVR